MDALPLPSDAGAPKLAREFVEANTSELPPELADDALILVSEVVTNAVMHGRPDIVLRVQAHEDGIGVAVHDCGDDVPDHDIHQPDPDAISGRGLLIVDAVASEWGIEVDQPPPGKTVWFELHPDQT